MSENWQQSEICIVINDKSHNSTAKHLSYDGLLHYKFVNHCAGETRTLSGTNNFLELSSIYHNSVTNNSKNAFLFSDYQ